MAKTTNNLTIPGWEIPRYAPKRDAKAERFLDWLISQQRTKAETVSNLLMYALSNSTVSSVEDREHYKYIWITIQKLHVCLAEGNEAEGKEALEFWEWIVEQCRSIGVPFELLRKAFEELIRN